MATRLEARYAHTVQDDIDTLLAASQPDGNFLHHRSDLPDLTECDAGKVSAPEESFTWCNEEGQQDVDNISTC